ncbi:hypothetical protein KHQ88_06545 [Mycoplasmatota bacterium]|nr:hypothetical protein KHQ88_06545 [Mycoplasmatota bacterium]
MRSIKKVLLIFALVFSVGALTACSTSSFEGIQANFEEEGYHAYEYKNPIAVNFDPEEPESAGLVPSQTFSVVDNMSIDLIDNYGSLDTITNLNYSVFLVAYSEEGTEDDIISKSGIVIVFPSEEHLNEALEVSETLQTYYADREVDDYKRGNLLLIIRTVDFEDEIVDIFNQPIE